MKFTLLLLHYIGLIVNIKNMYLTDAKEFITIHTERILLVSDINTINIYHHNYKVTLYHNNSNA